MVLALASALAAPACLDATPGECVEYRSFPGPYADAAAAQAKLQALIAADPLKAVQAAGMMHLWLFGPHRGLPGGGVGAGAGRGGGRGGAGGLHRPRGPGGGGGDPVTDQARGRA